MRLLLFCLFKKKTTIYYNIKLDGPRLAVVNKLTRSTQSQSYLLNRNQMILILKYKTLNLKSESFDLNSTNTL